MGAVFSTSNNHSSQSIEERVERALEVRELKAEIKSLKENNNQLRKELMKELNSSLQQHQSRSRGGPKRDGPSQVSVMKVDAFVDKMLSDPDTNLGFVPDMIERPAQRTMLLFLLKAVAHAVDTSAIEFMGHEIVLRMQPIVENCTAEDDDLANGVSSPPQYDSYHDDDYRRGGISCEESSDQAQQPSLLNAHSIPL